MRDSHERQIPFCIRRHKTTQFLVPYELVELSIALLYLSVNFSSSFPFRPPFSENTGFVGYDVS